MSTVTRRVRPRLNRRLLEALTAPAWQRASPISHVDRLQRPLLIRHGTSDVNVPYLHSVRLTDELLKKGKGELFEFMTYPGEFHYFTRAHVLQDAWNRVDRFFRRQLIEFGGSVDAN